jgi:hypothetical protein
MRKPGGIAGFAIGVAQSSFEQGYMLGRIWQLVEIGWKKLAVK